MTSFIADRKGEIKPREIILPGAPWMIAHKSMLKTNQPYKLTLNQQDYVIWKNNTGEIFALQNVCPHMQAPLSDGWICRKTKAITCPFHGLKFDSKGNLGNAEKTNGETLVQPLDLILQGDLIWTYGNYQPKLPIPELKNGLIAGYQFLGVAGAKSIQAPFLDCLKINYDFNHAIATHREPFKFAKISTSNYQEKGYHTSLDQKIVRDNNTVRELIANPALMTVAKVLDNHFEYFFPTITCVTSDIFLGKLVQLFVLYPQSTQKTKTFVLVYLQPKNIWIRYLYLLTKNSFLKPLDLIIKQDSEILASLYPKQQPKIRLPREEIMFNAEKLYQEWDVAK